MVGRLWFCVFSVMLASYLIRGEEVESQARTFPWIPSVSNCNYTKQPGLSCSGCNTLRICLQNNVGIDLNCGLFLPYCDNGYCTSSPSSSCNATGDNESRFYLYRPRG